MNSTAEGLILVVEDVPNILDFLEVTLSFKGYPVLTAGHGNEALEKIKEKKPALIITDILMPHLDGFGLAQKIRADPETRNIPIIMISATYVAKEDRDFALLLGAVRFLEKPVDTDEFLLTVAEILTQGPPNIPDPLPDKTFYQGYKERLESKLEQKNKQIQRTNRLLTSLSEDQKPAFETILREDLKHRDTIHKELQQIGAFLRDLYKTGTEDGGSQGDTGARAEA